MSESTARAVPGCDEMEAMPPLPHSLPRWMARPAVREALAGALVALLLAVAGHFYLAPASHALWARDQSQLMSNGGDATTLPFIYDVILQAARESPRNLLYGAIYNPRLGPPHASGMWVPWIERWVVVLFGGVLPLEALPTAFVWILMVLAGLSFYLFARMARWPHLLAFALALAFAFNPYTRARGVVHDALVGIYCMPLVFAALCWLKRDTRPVALGGAATLLVFSCWTAHYYLLILVVLAPLLLWFQLRDDALLPLQPDRPRGSRLRRVARVALAAAPAATFLAWNVLCPLVPSAPRARPAYPDPDRAPLYLRVHAARPIDYVSGDVTLGPRDLNPLRARVYEALVATDFDGSNAWERTNGIRWCVLLPFLVIVALLCVRAGRSWLRARTSHGTVRMLTYWAVFSALTCWLSLSPSSLSVYGHDLGPSAWVHALFAEFRVPSRFGPFCHFGVLALVGTCLAGSWERLFGAGAPRWRRALPYALPALMVLDYPPLQPVAMAQVLPPRFDLMAAGGGHCGRGMHFPYPHGAGSSDEVDTYQGFQQLRRTDCQDLQQPLATELHDRLLAGLGEASFEAAATAGRLPQLQEDFVRFARCARLDWVLFRSVVPEATRKELCQKLGWVRVAADACSSPLPRKTPRVDLTELCGPMLRGR